MKILKKAVCLVLCLILLSGLWACEEEKELPSSSTPVSTPAPVSSAPEPASSSAWFSPSQDLLPSAPPEGSTGFEAEFSQNPIDREYDRAYGEALSASMMRQACDEAAASWKGMVETAYQSLLPLLSEDEQAKLLQEQDSWDHSAAEELKSIQEEAGEGTEGALKAAQQTVLFYRQRAMELCKLKYDIDGELPPFPGEG